MLKPLCYSASRPNCEAAESETHHAVKFNLNQRCAGGCRRRLQRSVCKRVRVQTLTRAQLHMAHTFAGAFEQADGIGKHPTIIEPDRSVRLESIHVAKGC